MATNGQGKIILVRLSEIDGRVLAELQRQVAETFCRPVETRSAIRSLEPAYDSHRHQYRSPHLLNRLRRMKRDPQDMILGVADVDLYSDGYEFIFGEAEIATGIGTLSLFRLRPEWYGRRPDHKLLVERSVKEAVHELGHLYGLGHCTDPGCVMRACIGPSLVDAKNKTFCIGSGCRLKIGRMTQR